MGIKEFSSIAGLTKNQLELVLRSENEYVPVKVISIACQINKTHGDPDPNHSSVSECLKGTTVRLLPSNQTTAKPADSERRSPAQPLRTRAAIGPMYDQKSVRILNFGVNTITLLLVCYFLGGLVIAPLFNLQTCVGLSFSPPAASPCLGSIIGLVLGAFGSLGYTYYYFTRKV